MKTADKLIATGAIFAGLAVAFGAFGAHAVKDMVTADRLDNWETAALYQMVHALALILSGVLAKDLPSKKLRLAGILFSLGILFFSGSLYVLVLTEATWLGAITPLGGLAFILAWSLMAWEFIATKKD